MEIISHRGYWKSKNEKNSIVAFNRSFSLGFGTETDVRDFHGDLVISHDIASEDSLSIDELLLEYIKFPQKTLALNIKSDGLVKLLSYKLNEYEIKNYFVFDMSIPDSLSYINCHINFFLRQSEIESDMSLYDKSVGIWLDSFYSSWFDGEIIANHLTNEKKVCIVSPELHGRDYSELWSTLKKLNFIDSNEIILCTDIPDEANKYFNI
jgi:glycerophosphoryl diester phosphodiesterase